MTKKSVLRALLILIFGLGLLFFVALKTSCVVVVERKFDASPERLWQVWSDPESMKMWWSPKGFTAPVIENDLRVDGRFLLSMKAPDGKMHWNSGRYIEVVPYMKTVALMSFSDETGKMIPAAQVGLPGKWPDEIKITVEFKEQVGSTLIIVKEEGIPSIMYFFAKIGWNQQFDKLESLIKF